MLKNILWWIGSMVAVILVLCIVIEVTEPDKSNTPTRSPARSSGSSDLPNFKVN